MRLACLLLLAGCATAPSPRAAPPAVEESGVMAAMRPANLALVACVRGAPSPPAMVYLSIHVGKNGEVRDVFVHSLEDAIARLCAERVVRGVRFPPVEAPALAVTWPIKL